MGAGSFAAGASPAGLDAQSQEDRIVPTNPQAAYFDPTTRLFPYDTNGAIQSTHPVDHEVSLAVFVVLESIGGSSATGINRKKLKTATKANAKTVVTDTLNVALAAPLSRRDVRIISVEVDANVRGRLGFRLTYKNLRLPNSLPRIIDAA